MNPRLSRREAIQGSVALAALALKSPWSILGVDEPKAGEQLIPFLDVQPAGRPMLRWQDLTEWITPDNQVFSVNHYGQPQVDLAAWQLDISGLVRQPHVFTLEQLRSRPHQEVIATLECSGNSSNPGFMGAVANARWTGTPLAPLLRACDPFKRAREVVFFGADQKTEKIREKDYPQNFARSLSWADANRDDIILAYEMNGRPLTPEHGAPLRLIVPGWFGVAWVKWLTRIELLDRRYMSRFMARDYVTIRGEEKNGQTVWRETSVGPIDVKSMVARAVRRLDGTVRFTGAAWTDGTPLRAVEIKIDQEPWRRVELEKKNRAGYAWTFWHYDWKHPQAGEHTVVSRATDAEGRIQPEPEDPEIKLKRTYWEANQQHPRKLRLES